ncbi:MAG: hypothetical protein DBX55_03250 [Verrucomicrobia bacterium]|nr:MAG: hypothetical protein DBX55_03250 [Verrucomicrobiota bacterium]
MKILHCDCFSGISGDMFLAALLDLGADAQKLRSELSKLGLEGWRIEISRQSRGGVWGTRADVICGADCDSSAERPDADSRPSGAEGVRDFGHSGNSEACAVRRPSESGGEISGGHSNAQMRVHSAGRSRDNSREADGVHSHGHSSEDSRGGADFSRSRLHSHSCEHSQKHSHGRLEASDDIHSHSHSHECSDAHSHEHSAGHSHEHRAYSDIRKMILSSSLSERAKEISLKIFGALARAEAQVHNVPEDEVRFHEVGAVDSIIDIVGAAVGLELLGVDAVVSSPVELGGGTVRCAHGIMPVPAPATALLSKNFEFTMGGARHECTTPTGAAIIAALAGGSAAAGAGRCVGVGIGIGHRECAQLPNFLRAMLIEGASVAGASEEGVGSDCRTGEACAVSSESVVEFAANIDDMTAEEISEFCRELFLAGALDAWQEHIVMKKGRSATKVCALARRADFEKISACYLDNSSTLGVRFSEVGRRFVGREQRKADTPLGSVGVKVCKRGGGESAKPESDDVRSAAERAGLPYFKASREIGRSV